MFGVDPDEVIFVGGIALEAFGVRSARDIDLVANETVRSRLEARHGSGRIGPFAALNLTEDVQVLKDPYRAVGISDQELFSRELFVTFTVRKNVNIRIIRPELEFAKKNFRRRPKDIEDLHLLDYLSRSSNFSWDWRIVPTRATNPSINQSRGRRLLRAVFTAFSSPRKLVQLLRSFVFRCCRKLFAQWPKPDSKALSGLAQKTMDTGVLLQLQRVGGEFSRYDVLLRAIVARISFDRARDGIMFGEDTGSYWTEYQKMQAIRYPARASALRYRNLLEKIAIAGFQADRHPLVLSRSGVLLDGAHRLACAVALGVDRVPFVTKQSEAPKNFGRSWFVANDFSPELLEELDEMERTTLSSTGAYFRGIIWPPAQEFAAQILEDINAEYSIVSSEIAVECSDLASFTYRIYSSDDIERWKIDKKLSHFVEHRSRCTFFEIDITDPHYIHKVRSGSYMAQEVIELKRKIRLKYSALVEGYVEDIVIHIADNPAMSRDISRAFFSDQKNFGQRPHTSQPAKG
jgi:hypothetical protein